MSGAKAESKRVSSKKKKLLWFDELRMKEAEARVKGGSVVIFPVGSVEEHGYHLPLCTDSLQPEYVAYEVAKKTGCFVAPPLRYGVCNSARGFPARFQYLSVRYTRWPVTSLKSSSGTVS